jgi:hypothetical protein
MTSYVRQCKFFDYGNPGEQAWISTTLPEATLQGSTLLIFGAVSFYAGTRPSANINPTQNDGYPTGDVVNGQYTELQNFVDTQNDSYLALGLYIKQNANAVPSGTTFTQNYTAGDDYIAMAVVEVAGVSANSLITSQNVVQVSLASGTNNITTGNAALGSNPCIVIGLSVGAANQLEPNPGTAANSQNTGFGWGSANSALIESQHFTNPGSNTIYFSAPGTDDYMTVTVALSDSVTAAANVFRMFSNGSIQAHLFSQGPLPANTAMRMYSNNTLHSANLVTGYPNIKLYANGTLQCNTTIIV